MGSPHVKFAVQEPLHRDCASMPVNPWVDSFAASGPISNEYVSSQHTYLVYCCLVFCRVCQIFKLKLHFKKALFIRKCNRWVEECQDASCGIHEFPVFLWIWNQFDETSCWWCYKWWSDVCGENFLRDLPFAP